MPITRYKLSAGRSARCAGNDTSILVTKSWRRERDSPLPSAAAAWLVPLEFHTPRLWQRHLRRYARREPTNAGFTSPLPTRVPRR
jgi:hypothetical protein